MTSRQSPPVVPGRLPARDTSHAQSGWAMRTVVGDEE